MLIAFSVMAVVLAFFFVFNTCVVFAAEAEETANTGDVVEATNTLFNWFKTINMDDIRAWFTGLLIKFGVDTTLIISALIYIVRSKVKEAKQTAFYKELIAKLDAENAAKIEEIMNNFDSKLEALNNNFIATIKKQNAEKREEAKANVDQAKAALDEIKIKLDE